jgi:hypothetical protein
MREKNESHGGIIRLSIGTSIVREENPIFLKGAELWETERLI